MTDKPLDCIGLELTKHDVGKHDFRPSLPNKPIITTRFGLETNTRPFTSPQTKLVKRVLLNKPPE